MSLEEDREKAQLDLAIIRFLNSKKESVPPIQIAKALGFKTTKEINPTLYRLKDQGLLERTSNLNGSNPQWRLILN